MLTIPHCANNQYWFITEEWTEIIEAPTLATPDNPNPIQGKFARRHKQNLVIAMHPVAHAVLQQGSGKQDYVLTDPLLIKRELYDWVIKLNQEATKASTASGNGNLEDELRSAVADNSTTSEDSRTDTGVQVSPDTPLEG